uniref:Cytochrome c biogenesis protein transmembrane region n=1 Tax=Batrachospermum sp. TaxID=31373 RepID=A0A8K1YUY9_9FLOR|nr:cytochrome c biogenesis protein transmembrane region [Batrachospermum sp.]
MFMPQTTLYIYEIQHNVNIYFIQQINNITFLSFLTIFTGGLLTSLSPCMASSIPLIISYVNTQKQFKSTKLILILGILTSMFTIGIIAIIIKNNLLIKLHYLSFIVTLLFIVIGLNLLKIISIDLSIFKLFSTNLKAINNLYLTYILGIGIGLNISPCSTPILAVLIIWITNTKNMITGISLLLLYIIGYLTPIIACLISIPHFNKIKITDKVWYSLELITGALLISTGTFSLCNNIISILAV